MKVSVRSLEEVSIEIDDDILLLLLLFFWGGEGEDNNDVNTYPSRLLVPLDFY